jgi:hypothetical protein
MAALINLVSFIIQIILPIIYEYIKALLNILYKKNTKIPFQVTWRSFRPTGGPFPSYFRTRVLGM